MPVTTFNASFVQKAAINALVLAIAGMMFLANPSVSISVTPSILKVLALSNDFWYAHVIWSMLSLSRFVLGNDLSHSISRTY